MVRRLRSALVAATTIWLALPAPPAAAGGGCHLGVTQGRGTTVEMVDACFTPTILQVEVGDEVAFANRSGMAHNVTANQWGRFEDIVEGATYRVTFEAEGVYPYACSIHPGMSGAIVVGDGTGAGSGEAVSVQPFVEPMEPPAAVVPLAERAAEPAGPSAAVAWVAGGVGLAVGLAIGVAAARRLHPRST